MAVLLKKLFCIFALMNCLVVSAETVSHQASSRNEDENTIPLMSNEIIFWLENQKAQALPPLGNFKAMTRIFEPERLFGRFEKSYASLKQRLLALRPAPSNIKLSANNYSAFSIDVSGCSEECLRLLANEVENLELRSIIQDPDAYPQVDLLKKREFMKTLLAATEKADHAKIRELLANSPFLLFKKIDDNTRTALELTLTDHKAPEIFFDSLLFEDLVSMSLDREMRLVTLQIGASYKDFTKLKGVPAKLRELSHTQLRAATEPGFEDYKTIKVDSEKSRSGIVDSYVKLPLSMNALEYIMLKNDLSFFNANQEDPAKKIRIRYEKNTQNFVIEN